MSRFGAAGVIELIAGLCIMIGFGTRLAAFIASGEMAVAYFWMHTARAGSIWWWENGGEIVMLFVHLSRFRRLGSGPAECGRLS